VTQAPAEGPSFRTKTGVCTVEGGRLVLSRQGVRGEAAKVLVGASPRRVLLLYAIAAFMLGYVGVQSIRMGRLGAGIALCAAAALLAVSVMRSWNVSAAPQIPLSAIRRVEPHRGRAPLTRPYFVVHFDENKSLKKRLVMLPGVAQGGAAEFDKALEVLKQAGLPVDPR
jgi:hypothetical protein